MDFVFNWFCRRTTYITCPPDSRDKLHIRQPFLNLLLKTTGEEFGCKITVRAHTHTYAHTPITAIITYGQNAWSHSITFKLLQGNLICLRWCQLFWAPTVLLAINSIIYIFCFWQFSGDWWQKRSAANNPNLLHKKDESNDVFRLCPVNTFEFMGTH